MLLYCPPLFYENLGTNSQDDSFNQAIEYYREKDLNQSRDLCTQGMQKDPYNARPYHLLGLIFKDLAEYTSAREFIQTSISLDPENTMYKSNLGAIDILCDYYQEAKEILQDVIEQDPIKINAYINLGIVAINEQDWDQATIYLDKAVQMMPSTTAFALLAGIFYQQGSMDQARQFLKAAQKLDADDNQAVDLLNTLDRSLNAS